MGLLRKPFIFTIAADAKDGRGSLHSVCPLQVGRAGKGEAFACSQQWQVSCQPYRMMGECEVRLPACLLQEMLREAEQNKEYAEHLARSLDR